MTKSNEQEHPVVRHLRQMVSWLGAPPIEQAVLKYAKEFTGIARPKEFRPRAQRQCFKNAALLALDGRGIYVEGFGISLHGPAHHAWITVDGRHAIDVTWRDDTSRCAYFGIPFSTEVMERWMFRRINERGNLWGPLLEWSQAPFDDMLEDTVRDPPRFTDSPIIAR